jgi:hypothetical protein
VPARQKIPPAFRPKRPTYFLAFAWTALASLVVYVSVSLWWGWSPASAGGLTFGIAAAVLMTLEVLYALRRRLLIRPLNTGQKWLQSHIYGGVLAALFVLIHAGFNWPHGTFGFLLLALTMLVTITGVLGVVGQKLVPPTLANMTSEAIYERIPEQVAAIRDEATQAVTGASDRLQRFYGAHVQPALAGPAMAWSYLVDVRSDRDRRIAEFDGLRSFVDDADRQRLEQLQALLVKKIDLEAHYTWQTVLRGWLYVHVPAAMLLYALLIGHVAAVLRF